MDALLTLGATMRLTRLVVNDDLGQWWVKDPLLDQARRHIIDHQQTAWWDRYLDGLDCPYCVGFWLGLGVLAAHWPKRTRGAWQFLAAGLTLNEVAAHLGVLVGDFDS